MVIFFKNLLNRTEVIILRHFTCHLLLPLLDRLLLVPFIVIILFFASFRRCPCGLRVNLRRRLVLTIQCLWEIEKKIWEMDMKAPNAAWWEVGVLIAAQYCASKMVRYCIWFGFGLQLLNLLGSFGYLIWFELWGLILLLQFKVYVISGFNLLLKFVDFVVQFIWNLFWGDCGLWIEDFIKGLSWLWFMVLAFWVSRRYSWCCLILSQFVFIEFILWLFMLLWILFYICYSFWLFEFYVFFPAIALCDLFLGFVASFYNGRNGLRIIASVNWLRKTKPKCIFWIWFDSVFFKYRFDWILIIFKIWFLVILVRVNTEPNRLIAHPYLTSENYS